MIGLARNIKESCELTYDEMNKAEHQTTHSDALDICNKGIDINDLTI